MSAPFAFPPFFGNEVDAIQYSSGLALLDSNRAHADFNSPRRAEAGSAQGGTATAAETSAAGGRAGSGVAVNWAASASLVVTYGIGDCVGMQAVMPLSRVLAALGATIEPSTANLPHHARGTAARDWNVTLREEEPPRAWPSLRVVRRSIT